MITLDTIRKPVTAELEAFDEFVDRQFTAEGELLSDMLRYALSSRGKGIRPLLVLLSAAMNSPVAEAAKGAVHLAAMLVEMIHVASLIHDDVIDEATCAAASRRPMRAAVAQGGDSGRLHSGPQPEHRPDERSVRSGDARLRSMAALCEGEVLQSECAENIP